MEGNPQLNLYYCYPVAIINRFMCQPKFAGKTYMKFEGQEESRESGRNQSFLFPGVQPIDMHIVQLLHVFYAFKSFSGMH